jgi:hypothetical protein
MSTTGLKVFDGILHKTNSRLTWRKALARIAAPTVVYARCCSALREPLTVDEAAHLNDELPMLVRESTPVGCVRRQAV